MRQDFLLARSARASELDSWEKPPVALRPVTRDYLSRPGPFLRNPRRERTLQVGQRSANPRFGFMGTGFSNAHTYGCNFSAELLSRTRSTGQPNACPGGHFLATPVWVILGLPTPPRCSTLLNSAARFAGMQMRHVPLRESVLSFSRASFSDSSDDKFDKMRGLAQIGEPVICTLRATIVAGRFAWY